MATARTSHRTDIEGLRAFAVIAVIINHVSQTLLPYGFLGVDVFFVISGYVITSSLLSTEKAGPFTVLLGFYTRRIKRLTPALLACVGISTLALLAVDPNPVVSLWTGIFALFGASNIYLYSEQVNYFASDTAFNAFMHTWSLGVEEQFYLLLPLAIILFRPARRLGIILGLLSVASWLWFILAQANNPEGAFFLLPSRLWEMGSGATLAALGMPQKPFSGRTGGLTLQTLLLCGVMTVIAIGNLDLRLATGIVVAATVGTIGSSDRSGVLTHPVANLVGRLSYSLYLWHWPILVVLKLSHVSGWIAGPVFIGLLAAASTASFYLVEQPLRHKMWSKYRLVSLLYGVLASGGMIAALVVYTKSIPSDDIQLMLANKASPAWEAHFLTLPSGEYFNPTCVASLPDRPLRPETFSDCTFPPKPGSQVPMVWAMGDSHAGHFEGLLAILHHQYGVGFHLVETPGYPFPDLSENGGFKPRAMLYAEMQKHVAAGDTIFLSRLYLNREDPVQVLGGVDAWIAALDQFAAEMGDIGVQIVVEAPTPMYGFTDIRSCLRDDPQSCSTPRAPLEALIGPLEDKLDAVAGRHRNVRVLKLFDVLCPATDKECHPTLNGLFTMRDRDHLTVLGAYQAMPQMLQFLGLPAHPSG